MTNSRNKGSAFEREVAGHLHSELGMTFKRDLDQYRERDRGDLIPSDPAFPFVIECKRYAKGADAWGEWIAQVFKASAATGKYPALIWKFDRQPVRVRVWFDAMGEAFGGAAVSTQHADLTIQGFAYVAREIMAGRAAK